MCTFTAMLERALNVLKLKTTFLRPNGHLITQELNIFRALENSPASPVNSRANLMAICVQSLHNRRQDQNQSRLWIIKIHTSQPKLHLRRKTRSFTS